MADPIYVAAYVKNDADRAAALEALQDAHDYGEIVEGYADDEAIAKLTDRKILVAVVEDQPQQPAATSLRRSKRTDPILGALVDRLRARARKIVMPKAGMMQKLMRRQGVMPRIQNMLAMVTGSYEEEDAYRVHVRGSLRDEWLAELRARGIEIVSHRRNAYEMFLTPTEAEWLKKKPYVLEVTRYDLLDTVHTTLLAQMARRGDAPKPEPQRLDLMLHRPADRPRVEQLIRELAGEDAIEESSDYAIRFHAPIDDATLAALADLPWVKTLMPCQPTRLFAVNARAIVGLPAPPAPAGFPWNGDGEIVGIIDSGIDRTHLDLKDRLATEPIPFEDCPVEDQVGHGTHIAGIIAGTGAAAVANGQPPVLGIAPAAKLVIVSNVRANGSPRVPIDVGPLFDLAVQQKATILNVSWGRDKTHGLYDPTAESLDRYVREHPQVLVVVAAGNEGAAPDGTCEFNTLLTPASAKNALTVGACLTSLDKAPLTWGTFPKTKSRFAQPAVANEPVAGNPDLVAAISSRGPTDFDSVKPDLVAPGTFILGPRARMMNNPNLMWEPHASNAYVYIGGTSMAAPVVAGCAALLRQYLRVARGTPEPSAALLKSLLIGGAARLPSSRSKDGADQVGYPDFDQGFGRIDLHNLLPADAAADPPRKIAFVDVANDSADALGNKKSRSYSIFVSEGDPRSLIITLVWTDLPGKDVQNQLTLDVTSPAGQFIGNATHTHLKNPLFKRGVIFDKRNNVQQVRIDEAAPGEYVINVTGLAVLRPKQGFAISVIGELQKSELQRLGS